MHELTLAESLVDSVSERVPSGRICGSADVELRTGRELSILDVEVI